MFLLCRAYFCRCVVDLTNNIRNHFERNRITVGVCSVPGPQVQTPTFSEFCNEMKSVCQRLTHLYSTHHLNQYLNLIAQSQHLHSSLNILTLNNNIRNNLCNSLQSLHNTHNHYNEDSSSSNTASPSTPSPPSIAGSTQPTPPLHMSSIHDSVHSVFREYHHLPRSRYTTPQGNSPLSLSTSLTSHSSQS